MRRASLATATAMVAGSLTGVVATAAPASAAEPAPVCDTTTCTVTYSSTGAVQTFTVPSLVTSVTATVDGARGGNVMSFGTLYGAGGHGGRTVGTLAVSGGDTFSVVVGGAGGNADYLNPPSGAGGYAGGGNAGGSSGGAGGGGGSFVFNASDTLLIAAGGGGGGARNRGGGAGAGAGAAAGAGANGSSGATGGGAATASAHGSGGVGAGGGASGTAGSGSVSGPSSLPLGGTGGSGYSSRAGGGGGGGYYAGGGGGANNIAGAQTSGAGGGGAGYAAGSVTSVTGSAGVRNGNGSVVFSWTAPYTQSVSFTPLTSPAKVGTTQTMSATGGSSGNPVVFSVGAGTTNSACSVDVDGTTLHFDNIGTCVIDADQAGDGTYAAGHAQQSVQVDGLTTTTTLSPGATTLSAEVVPESGAAPTGTVAFTVDGNPVGSADLSSGLATLDYTLSHGVSHEVLAEYGGDAQHVASQDTVTRSDPTITAKKTASKPKKGKWYRVPVTITFQCTTTTAPLSKPCPSSILIDKNGKGQTRTRKAVATDGGLDKVTVMVNLDQTKPTVRVKGVKAGATYYGSLPKTSCVVRDKLSHAAGCTLTKHRKGHRVTFVAKGFDKAGNKNVVRKKVYLY